MARAEEQPYAGRDRWARLRGLRPWQVVLALAPLLLVAIGGLIGGLCGALAAMANLSIARIRLGAPLQALLMLLVGAVAVVVWAVVGTAVAALLS